MKYTEVPESVQTLNSLLSQHIGPDLEPHERWRGDRSLSLKISRYHEDIGVDSLRIVVTSDYMDVISELLGHPVWIKDPYTDKVLVSRRVLPYLSDPLAGQILYRYLPPYAPLALTATRPFQNN